MSLPRCEYSCVGGMLFPPHVWKEARARAYEILPLGQLRFEAEAFVESLLRRMRKQPYVPGQHWLDVESAAITIIIEALLKRGSVVHARLIRELRQVRCFANLLVLCADQSYYEGCAANPLASEGNLCKNCV